MYIDSNGQHNQKSFFTTYIVSGQIKEIERKNAELIKTSKLNI